MMWYQISMGASAIPRMTADEFIDWALDQPKEAGRFELEHGVVVSMAPERVSHVRAKLQVVRLLADAIAAAELPCEAFTDGLAVQVDEKSVYEPDALVRCGQSLEDDVVRISDPLVIVEVSSPSAQSRDSSVKLSDYFRLSSLRHYLIVASDLGTVIHHARRDDGSILTRIVRDGAIHLDPPGIVLDGLFPAEMER